MISPSLIACLAGAVVTPKSQPQERPPPIIELITMGPGKDLYTLWGHAAIRVIYPGGPDLAYNFGSIDFSPGFLTRMLQKQVEASLSRSQYRTMLAAYSREDRTITRQTLALSPKSARATARKLNQLAQAKSRYRYHHFEDNCATRVAEIVNDAFSHGPKNALTSPSHETFRSLALRPVRQYTWLYVAVDLALSGSADRTVQKWEETAFPAHLAALASTIRVRDQPIVKDEVDAYRSKTATPNARWTWPWIKVYLLLLLPLLAALVWRRRLGVAVFSITLGVVGSGLTLLMLGSGYDFMERNWGVLVCPPTHLVLAVVALWGRQWRSYARWSTAYLGAHLVILGLIAVGSTLGLIGQAVAPSLGFVIPLTVVSLFRRHH